MAPFCISTGKSSLDEICSFPLENQTPGVLQWCAGHSDSVHVNPTPYIFDLRHFSTEMDEIWSPVTSYQDVFAYKISALYHLYFQSYKAFSGGI